MTELSSADGSEGYAACDDDGPLVKWLRRRPLTPQTRVRLSYGSPFESKLRIIRFHASVKAHSLRCFLISIDKHFVGLPMEPKCFWGIE